MLSHMLAAVKEIPEFRPLIPRVPLSKLISVGKKPLFGTRLLLIPACPPHATVQTMLRNGIQQCHRL